MSASATVHIDDEITPHLREIAQQIKNPQALYKDVGRKVAGDLRKHFRERNQTPNKLGGKRTYFWQDVRDAVQQPVTDAEGVDVVIASQFLAAKVYGATITPKSASALTIPLHQLAHGRRASTFEQETGKKLFRPKGKNILMADLGSGPVPIYALRKRVTVPRDDDALPERSEMESGVLATSRAHLARMLARQA